VIGRWFGRKSSPDAPTTTASPGATVADSPARETIDAELLRGLDHLEAKRHDRAIAVFEDVLAADPAHLVANYQRVNALLEKGDVAAADAACDAALALLPDQPDLLMLSGAIAAAAHDPTGALERFERARAANPALGGVDERIGEQLAFLGRGAEAVAACDRAIARQPDNFALGSHRLFLLDRFGLFDRQRTFDEHRAWGERIERSVAAARRPHMNDRSPGRGLRVGFVAPDRRNHAVAPWLESYLVAHDREAYSAHAFDVSPCADDEVSKRLRGRFDRWYRCGAMSDDELAGLVRGQRIDVLVDLAGHDGHSRLAVFARKPAPVQASWFGHMNTTGLSTIDWRLTDARHDPPGSEACYTERLWRIPSPACFMPDPESPDPGPPPFERNGHVTFASANDWTKVSEATKDTWAAILRAVPDTRLRVIARGRDAVLDAFAQRGVAGDRVDVLPFLPLASFLAFFRDADVALDPFPCGGGTTTLRTLWMGVPVVTLEGDAGHARATPAAMRGVDAADFVASTPSAYVEIASSIARRPDRLAQLRPQLRARLEASGAMDYPRFARDVEAALREMWRAYCAQPPAAPPPPLTSSRPA